MELFGIEIDIYVAIVMIAIGLILAIIWLCIGILSKASQSSLAVRKKRGTKKRSPAGSRKTNAAMESIGAQGQMSAYDQEYPNPADMAMQTSALGSVQDNQSAINPAADKKQPLNQAPVQVQMDAVIENVADNATEQKPPNDTASRLWQPEVEETEESKETDSIFEIFQQEEAEESSDISTIAANVTTVEIDDLLNLNRELAPFSRQNVQD